MFTSLTPERQNLEVVPLQNECLAHETAPIFNCFFFFFNKNKKKTKKQNKTKFPSLLKERVEDIMIALSHLACSH